jgi:caffeoyl-CoA O-methyltransferase
MAEPKSFLLSSELAEYLVAHGSPPDELQQRLIAETRALGGVAGMQVAPEQGAFLTLLTRVTGARNAVEIGTFTGYSALCIARGLPSDGRLLCCDVSADWTAVGRRYWDEAGIGDRVDLRIAPALETIAALPAGEQFDLAFIDADKPNYANYLDALAPKLKPNGVLLVDNVLWSGNVLNAEATDDNTVAIKAFNDKLAADDRFDVVMLPISDGLTLARKR